MLLIYTNDPGFFDVELRQMPGLKQKEKG